MTPRVTSSILAGALIRMAEADGGFGAVLRKGDGISGAILVLLSERGAIPRLLERILQPDGRYAWHAPLSSGFKTVDEVARFVDRRRQFDPDLWVLELDIASAERFAADMNALG